MEQAAGVRRACSATNGPSGEGTATATATSTISKTTVPCIGRMTGSYPSPPQLFDGSAQGEREALVIVHHPAHGGNFCDWKDHSPEHERLVEIFQITRKLRMLAGGREHRPRTSRQGLALRHGLCSQRARIGLARRFHRRRRRPQRPLGNRIPLRAIQARLDERRNRRANPSRHLRGPVRPAHRRHDRIADVAHLPAEWPVRSVPS